MRIPRSSPDDRMRMGRTISSSSSVSCMLYNIVVKTSSHSRSIRIVSPRSHGSRRKMQEPNNREMPKIWNSLSSSTELSSGSSQMNTKTPYSSGKRKHGVRYPQISAGNRLYLSDFCNEKSLARITREYSYCLREYIWIIRIFSE